MDSSAESSSESSAGGDHLSDAAHPERDSARRRKITQFISDKRTEWRALKQLKELQRQPIPLRTFWFMLLLVPAMLATMSSKWFDTGVPLYTLAGTMMLLPASVVLYKEGWTGFFTATCIASTAGYFLYCHNVITLGDGLVSNQRFAYPAIASELRNQAAWVNLAGCSAMVAGLLVAYRRKRKHPDYEWLPRGAIYVPDITLRNAVIFITVLHLGSRMYIIWRAGFNPITYMLSARGGEFYIYLAGDAGFLAQFARVFQAAAMTAGAVLLARRSKCYGARTTAYVGIAMVVALAALMGNRGHAIAYMISVMAFGVTIPVPRINRLARLLVPLGMGLAVLLFAFLTVYRDVGFTNLDQAQGRNLGDGVKQMLEYDQATMLEQVLYTTPEFYPPLNGSSLIALPLNPVPRVIWPEKPIGMGVELAARMNMDEHLSLSAGLIGEGYINFLMLGAVMLPLCFGLLAGFWDRLRNLGNVWPDVYALWIAGLPGIFYSVRGDVLTGGSMFMYTAAGTLIILVCFGKSNLNRLAAALAGEGRLPQPEYARMLGEATRDRER